MQFALNYSHPAVELFRAGRIAFDLLKCPAWPDLVAEARQIHPTYVHFPLRAGMGIGDAFDTDTGAPADWRAIESLLQQTGTPFVNLHLTQTAADHPDIPPGDPDPDRLLERMLRDVRAVVARFGAERVVVENLHGGRGTHLRPAILPQTIRRVVEETGCGLLLDVSHARLAARLLKMDARQYIAALPTGRIREVHLTGLQRFEGHWVERLRRAGVDAETIAHWAGHLTDHVPLTGADWDFTAWVMEQIHSGAWGRPQIVAFEYGGVGPLWSAITDRDALAAQVPRLYALVKQNVRGA